MATNKQVARLWDVIEKVGVGMLTTVSERGLRARPLEARPDREAECILFVTDVRGSKDDELTRDHHAGLVFVDAGEKVYVSLAGEAVAFRDTHLATAIWRDSDSAWWPDGPDDPNVRVLRFKPYLAEYWDGPASREVVRLEFAKARATGEKPNLGQNRKVTIDLD